MFLLDILIVSDDNDFGKNRKKIIFIIKLNLLKKFF
jgi:hypothetical protein